MAFKNSYSLASKVCYLDHVIIMWLDFYIHICSLRSTTTRGMLMRRGLVRSAWMTLPQRAYCSSGWSLTTEGGTASLSRWEALVFVLVTLTTLCLSTVRGRLAIPYRFFLLAVLSKLWLLILHCPAPLGWIWWRNGCLCHKGHFTISSESLHINSIMQSLWSDMYMYM